MGWARAAVVTVLAALAIGAAPPARAELQHPRQAWLRDSTAGLFLHWGMFTSPRHLDCREWERAVTDGGWTPDYWVREAQKLRASYLVLATFHSRLGYARPWPSKIPGSCATERDFLGELVAAGKREGVKVILYMTDDPQWHGEQGVETLDSGAYSAHKGKDVDLTTRDGFGEYSYDLFFEVMREYPDLAGFWIDNDNAYWERNHLYEQIRELRPSWLLSNNNEDTPIMDTVSNEQKTGMTPPYDYPQAVWTPMPRLTEADYKLPSTGSWWYDGRDRAVDYPLSIGRYVTNAGSSIKSLMAETAMVDGRLPPSQEAFNDFMAGYLPPIWNAIGGTEGGGYMFGGMQPGAWNDGAHGVITVRGDRQFVHVTTKPRSEDFVRIRDNGYEVTRVSDVRTGQRLRFVQSGGYLTILGVERWDPYDTVFEVRTAGRRHFYRQDSLTATATAGVDASALVDGSYLTYWDANRTVPVSIDIDLGARKPAAYLAINQREWSPTHNRQTFGRPEDSSRIKDYRVFVDGEPVKSGTLPSARGVQFIDLGHVRTRHIRLEVLSAWGAPTAPNYYNKVAIDELYVARDYVGGNRWRVGRAILEHDAGAGTLSLAVRDVLQPSPLGTVTERADLSRGLRFLGRTDRPIAERYRTTVGKRRERTVRMTESRFAFAGEGGARLDLVVRASRDGVAYRYVVPDGPVLREASAFTVPADAPAWLARHRRDYENPFVETTAGGAEAAEFMTPALFEVDGTYLLLAESDLDGRYSGSRLIHDAGTGTYRIGLWDPAVAVAGPLTTPWRAMIVGDLVSVTESTLVDDLAPPTRVNDTSWVRPGQVLWTWLAGGRAAGQSLEKQKAYVDYASARGWPYVAVDAGWYFLRDQWDVTDPNWKTNSWMPELVRYARAKGVDILVWIHFRDLDTPEERAEWLPTLEQWGVKGVKIDFMDSESQERLQWYDEILPATARHHLLVNFHGSNIPKGIHRTWPHVMTMEGVHGQEKGARLTTSHIASLPFTRNVVGSMDYTPMAFHRARPTTDAHELGLSVVYESGLQNLAGTPESYDARPEAVRFLEQVPTVWDETRLLSGRPGDSAVLARRSDRRWFLGGSFSGAARTARVPLDIGHGRWLVEVVRDGAGGLIRERREIRGGELSVDVAQDGGFAAIACRRPAATCDAPRLESVELTAADTSLPLDGRTAIRVRGRMSDGSAADLDDAEISVTGSDRDVAAVTMDGARGTMRAGTMGPGATTLTARVTLDGATASDDLALQILPRPARRFVHDYHQTLTMKMFMADNKGQVSLTFEQGLEVIKKVDNLTRGIPKIFYLVGWQYDGHDTGYPAWDVVNPKLKRPQDATALQSLRWLIAEGRKYHTTVSFHINMLDASTASPLWQTYLDADVIARNADGSLRRYVWGHPISYTREWNAGLTQRRIDTLLDMFDMAGIGTVHIDALHQYIPDFGTEPISPYHGVTTDQEVEAQKKIIRYFGDRGVDVTSEFAYSYRKDPLLGLQPMSWHFRNVDQMQIPPTLHIGGAGGDARFGASMQGEARIKRDPVNLAGFLDEFATTTLAWQYLNRLERISDRDGVVTFSDGVTSRIADGKPLIRQGDVVLRDGDDVFVPALWNGREIVAYSWAGYASRAWRLPAGWDRVRAVDVYRIGLDGRTPVVRGLPVRDGELTLGLPAGRAVSVVPHRGGAGVPLTVADPGFERGGSDWTLTGGAQVSTSAPKTGARHALLPATGASVAQSAIAPETGSYDLSAWAHVIGDGAAGTISVAVGGRQVASTPVRAAPDFYVRHTLPRLAVEQGDVVEVVARLDAGELRLDDVWFARSAPADPTIRSSNPKLVDLFG